MAGAFRIRLGVATDAAEASRDPGFTGTPRFRPLGLLGEGSMGRVYRVLDTELGVEVALKTFRSVDPNQLYVLKQEFRALVDVTHPNLVKLHELIVDRERSFFTMDLVAGVSFLDWVRPGDEPDVARLRRVLGQLARALAALHAAGKLHRDVKPSNVMVTRAGRVVVLDFGLVAALTREDRDGGFAGTLGYVAPEQAWGGAADPAADWYSVGAMAYEALTGRLPFGGDPDAILGASARGPAPRPRALWPGVPDDLDRLVAALLDPDPHRRAGARDLLAVATRPAAAGALPGPPPADEVFVGRAAELAALRAIAGRAAARRTPAIVHMHGTSGIGKSALLRRFLAELAGDDRTLVLAGRCHVQESVPYKAFDSVIDRLSRFLLARPDAERARLLDRTDGALVRLFPVLARVPGIERAPSEPGDVEPRETHRRAVAALRALLTSLAADRTVVVAVDDLQWGDDDSATLLHALLRPPDPPPIVVLLAYRTEERARASMLRALDAGAGALPGDWTTTIPLEPLTSTDALDLARWLCGGGAAEHAGLVARESGGSPFLAGELARSIADGQPAVAPGHAAGFAADLVTTRIRRLRGHQRRLLELVAVAGGPLDRSVVLDAARLGERGRPRLRILEEASLVRSTSLEGRLGVEAYHDRVREAALGLLAPPIRRRRHQALADALRRHVGADPETLFTHYRAAGDRPAAATYAVAAAELAENALAFDRAARLLAEALEHGGGERGALLVRLAEALANAGRGEEAAARYLEAAAAMEQGGAQADAVNAFRRRAAEQLCRSGALERGLAAMREMLETVGLRLPSSTRAAGVAAVVQHARLAWRGFAVAGRAADAEPAALARLDACWVAAISLSVVDPILGEPFAIRHLVDALDLGEPGRVVRALGYEAARAAAVGGRFFARRSARLLARVEHLAADGAPPSDRAWFHLATGSAAYFRGEHRLALDHLDRALALWRTRCRGVAWEIVTAESFAVSALARLGRMQDLDRRLPPAIADVDARSDVYGSIGLRAGIPNLCWLAADAPDRARREADGAIARWPDAAFHIQHYLHLLAVSHVDLYRGDPWAAWDRLEAAWPRVRRSGLLRISSARVDLLALRGKVALAAATSHGPREAGRAARRLLRITDAAARRLAREPAAPARALAALLRVGVARARGDAHGAVIAMAEAERACGAAEMALEAAAVDVAAGGTRRAAGEAAMRALGVRRPAAMMAVVAPGLAD
jgi:tetratricopeptide (TPR) repeat protein